MTTFTYPTKSTSVFTSPDKSTTSYRNQDRKNYFLLIDDSNSFLIDDINKLAIEHAPNAMTWTIPNKS